MAKKATQTTAVANWDEELAKYAQAGANLTTAGGGGKFFSTRAGVLSYDDVPLPGNEMCCIVASWCLENVYYDGPFDADNRTPPTCFAFCKDPDAKDEMAPDPEHLKDPVFDQQHEDCKGCPQNEWGSSDRGRGKACTNRRRLALIPAGAYKSLGKNKGTELEMYTDESHFSSAEPGYLKVPVTSGKAFDAYVKQVMEAMARPLFAVYTHIWLEPDPKTQFKVCFELIDRVENDLLPIVMARHKELDKGIDFPYLPFKEEEAKSDPKAAAKLGRGGGKTKPAAKGRR